jgi:hypothetical protein
MPFKGNYTLKRYYSLKDKIANALELKYGSSDKFDIEAIIDSNLNEGENLRIAEDEFDITFDKDIPKSPISKIIDLSKSQKKIKESKSNPDRKMHYCSFKPLSSKIPIYNLFGFDIETTGNSNDFLMGSIVGDKISKTFWDKQEMISYFINNTFYHNTKIFATNLGFDILALMQETEYVKQLKLLLRGSKIIMARLPVKSRQDHGGQETKKQLTFLDTMNYYPYSVKDQGKIIKLDKLETPPYIIEKRKPRENEMEYIEQYNMRDSEITFRFASFLQSSFNSMGCKMKITSASTAMDLFKRKYLNQKMHQEDLKTMENEYKAYYGGRVEVFQRGLVKDANYYDFNSLYPSVMRNEYPDVSSSISESKGKISNIEDYHGISEIKITCPDNIDIPILPFRNKGKLSFPTGTFKGWYSHIEIRRALEMGYEIKEMHKQVYYTRNHHLFKQYMEDMYKIRKLKKENKDISELIIKLLMNSLYGKFGQKIYGHQKVYHMDNIGYEDIKTMDKKGDVMIAGDWIYYTDLNPTFISSHIFPIYALYTTAYGRLKLYDAIKGCDPVYVDTDSIITKESLPESKELGMLKREYAIQEGIFIKPKMYGFMTDEGKSVIRIKGNNASFGWDYDRFKQFIDNPKTNQMLFSSFKMSNKKGISYNTISNTEKKFNLEDDKRIWKSSFDPLLCQNSNPINL